MDVKHARPQLRTRDPDLAAVSVGSLKPRSPYFYYQDLVGGLTPLRVESLSGMRGQSITLAGHMSEEHKGSHMEWFHGPVKPTMRMAMLFKGMTATDYSEKFANRLQLDRETGSLHISNLSTDDSGIYQLKLPKGEVSLSEYHLSVYSGVPHPAVALWETSLRTGSCWVLCSVENGRDVTLSWYRGNETLNQTSSPDLNTNPSLPLEIEEYRPDYSCVAANPVSNQTLRLNTETLCQAFHTNSLSTALWLCLIFPSLLLLISIFWKWQKSKRKPTTVVNTADSTVYSFLGGKHEAQPLWRNNQRRS